MLSCLYHKLSTQQWTRAFALTCVNSSANQRAISSEASGYCAISGEVWVQLGLVPHTMLIGIKEHK